MPNHGRAELRGPYAAEDRASRSDPASRRMVKSAHRRESPLQLTTLTGLSVILVSLHHDELRHLGLRRSPTDRKARW
jgi:hypothetical protein